VRYFKTSLFIVIIILFATNAYAKNILYIASYDLDMNWTKICHEGVLSSIGSQHNVESIFMDTKRKPVSAHQAIADKIWGEVLKKKPDLIMLADDNALKYLAPKLEKTKIKVVVLGINANPRIYFSKPQIPTNFTGVLERLLLIPVTRGIKKITPLEKKKVLILFDNSPTSTAIVDVALYNKKSLTWDGTTVEWQAITYYENWKKAVITADDEYDAILLSTWATVKHRDTGEALTEKEILEWTGQNSPVPIFAMNAHVVGSKMAVGAMVLDGHRHGKDAAEMALKILNNEETKQWKTTKNGIWYFNKANLKKYNLTLPAEIEKDTVFQ